MGFMEASIQSKLKELANLLMKEGLEREDIEIARKIASEIDSDTVYGDKREMKEEFLRLTFGYDINEENLSSLPTMVDGIFYLRDMVSVYSVKKIVKKHPPVLGYSIDKMKEKVEYIKSLGVDNVGKVVENCPQVLGNYSIDNLNRKVKYIESLGLNIGKVVEKFPQVFGLSIDNLNRKLRYFIIYGTTLEYIENNSSILKNGLYTKIIPRLRYVSSKTEGDIKKYGLDIFGLMYPSDDKFIPKLQKKGIAADKEEYSKLLDHYKQIDELDK
jgi:hypothetical protein